MVKHPNVSEGKLKIMGKAFQSLPLNPLRAFAVASQHKTFTDAARYMGVSQVAISRQVTILEDFLDVKLFERGSRSVRLTDIGRAFSHDIVGLFDDLETATQRILGHESDNTVHLRIYPTLAHYWLMPRLPDFKARFPNYRVRLDTNVRPLDFRGTHLDVAVQLGRGDWSDARSLKLFDETVDVVCSPGYRDSAGGLASPGEINPADLLHARYRRREWEVWASAVGADINHREGLEFDTSLLTYSACAAGMGLAIGQLDVLAPELESGRLICPFNQPVMTGAAFYVVWSTATSVNTKTRHFIDWMLEQAGQPSEFFKNRRVDQV